MKVTGEGLADHDDVMKQTTHEFAGLLRAKRYSANNVTMDKYWHDRIVWAERKGKQNLVRAKLTGNAMNLVTRNASGEIPARQWVSTVEFCSEWWHLWSGEYQQPIQNAMHLPFLSAIPSIQDRRAHPNLAAQLLLAEFLSPDFYHTGKPWRQRWNVPCKKCFHLTENYHGSRQCTRCQECIDIFDMMRR